MDEEREQEIFAAKTAFVFIGIIFVLVVAGAFSWVYFRDKINSRGVSQQVLPASEVEEIAEVKGLELEPGKNYGDKYAAGGLPVGDGKYVTSGARKGSVYLCDAKFVPENQAGTSKRGPWFIGTNKWDSGKKPAVRGSRKWTGNITNTVNGGQRAITTNGLPSHMTGDFPIAPTDPTYVYDRNPSSIKSQGLTMSPSASPAYSATPSCMGGEVGILLTGALLFNAFDAAGRDAGAWEVQDECGGHPQAAGFYHYHTLSSCIKDIGIATVIGFALDGFPITGPKVGNKNYLTTSDLDECHGIISEINLDGKKVKMYHYVMTRDFPYSVSCFRGKVAQSSGQAGGQQPGSQQRAQPLDVQGGQQGVLGP
jgi:hypothetical protein